MTAVKIKARDLVDFALENGLPTCFGGWSRDAVWSYLDHHASQGTCVVLVSGSPRRVVALAVGWQDWEMHLRRPGFADNPCVYQNTNPHGDSFYVADVVLTGSPRQRARHWSHLVAEFTWMFPNWRALKLFGLRHGRLVQWNPERLIAKLEGLS